MSANSLAQDMSVNLLVPDYKRKISYGTRSDLGKAAWENMLSILDTCRKLKVSFFKYVRDIYSNDFLIDEIGRLARKSLSN
jgi:hypothetical protein